MRTTNRNTAAACREMGLQIGDTIIGRAACKGWWHEAALTLIWLGDVTAVFREVVRTDREPEWRPLNSETANWDLTWRDWRRAEPGEVTV